MSTLLGHGFTDLRTARQQISASKARAAYVESGRGLMLSRIIRDGDPEVPPIPVECGVTFYRNTYIPRVDLSDADADTLRFVDSYDPVTQAVVVIEYALDGELQPEIVVIIDGEWVESIDDSGERSSPTVN